MRTESVALSATQIMAAAASILVGGGYRQAQAGLGDEWTDESARLFEDPYSVVAVLVFPTWAELKERWPQAQASLVTAITRSISSADPKVWEGYLVLLTPSTAGPDRAILDSVRRDTSRVRKLVATGEELRHLLDVEQLLSGLLPLDVHHAQKMLPEDPLNHLPSLPALRNVPRDAIKLIVDAFRDQQPMLDRLHQARKKQ
ncbi:MAG: hypothetical protein QOH92_1079 [Chloroflexota bacterium]|nr:hypothetical protein [Chloroflexota bacterium]